LRKTPAIQNGQVHRFNRHPLSGRAFRASSRDSTELAEFRTPPGAADFMSFPVKAKTA